MSRTPNCFYIFLTLVALLHFSNTPSAQALSQDAETTSWSGTLDARGTKLRLEITITKNGDELTGELVSVDQGGAKLKLTEIKVDGKKLRFSVPRIGAKFVGDYEGDGKFASGTFTQSGVKLPLELTKGTVEKTEAKKVAKEKLKAAWVGKLELGVMNPVMQFRVVEKDNGETGAYFDSVTEGRTGFEAKWSEEDGLLKFEVKEIRLTFEGELNNAGDTAEGVWTQAGREVPLILKKKTTEYDNKNTWENRPQRPVGPFPYDAEDVRFKNERDNITLAGTLTIPKKAGKHPVVVLISGSGAQDRDETLMEHKPFLVLADYLSRNGVAVLRFDDRGTADSTGDFAEATTEDFAHDASAAVEFLKNHERINANEIGLAGHSEGGLIAPIVCGLRDDVAFVCLLAATGVDGAKIVKTQTEAMLRASGMEEDNIKIEMAISHAVMGIAVEHGDKDDFSKRIDEAIEKVIETVIPEDEREEGGKKIRTAINQQKDRLQSKWMQMFLSYDPRPALRKIECPVLAIVGTKDLQVLADLNMPEIRKALTEGGNKDFQMVELDDLNHLFQKCETGIVSEYVTIMETFNPEALKVIGDWIVARTTQVE